MLVSAALIDRDEEKFLEACLASLAGLDDEIVVVDTGSADRSRDIARDAGAFVIEDDFAGRLVHADAPPLPPPMAAGDHDGVVVHIRSLTKPTSPSLIEKMKDLFS